MLRLPLLVLLLLLGSGPAFAHAVLVEAAPEDGQRLSAAPAEVRLTFNEPISPVSVRVLDAAGTVVAGPDGMVAAGAELHLPLPAGLPQGRYLVSYRITSIDAHPVAGSIAFGVGVAAEGSPPGTAMAAGAGWRVAAPLARFLADLGLLVAAGLGLFSAYLIGREDGELRSRLAGRRRLAAGIGIAATVLGLPIQGGLLGDLPLASLLGAEPWQLGFASTTGRSATLAVLGALLLLPRTARWRTPLAVLAIAASFAASGHAAAAPPRWLAVPAVMLHALGIAYWLGGLVGLEAALARGPLRRVTLTVRRFAGIAVPAVLGLLMAGGIVAVLQVRDPHALIGTGYGLLLLLKLALVAMLLALALYNNRWLTPRLRRGDGSAAAAMRGSVRAELICGVLILLVTVTLGRTPPPRALAVEQASRPGIAVVTSSRGTLALVELAPGEDGYAIAVSLFEADGRPVRADEVGMRLANPGAGIEPIALRLWPADGGYAARQKLPPIPGRWSLRVDARIGDFDKLIFETEAVTR